MANKGNVAAAIGDAINITEIQSDKKYEVVLQISFMILKATREAIVRGEYYRHYHIWRTIRRIERAHNMGLDVKGDAMGLLNPDEHPDAPFRHVRVGGYYDIWSKPTHPVKDCICCGYSFGGADKICTPCIERIK